MNKYIITFGSDQLQELRHIFNPMKVMVVVHAGSEMDARNMVFKSFIGKNFCTSYPYSEAQEFKDKYNMFEIEFEDITDYIKWQEQKNIIINNETEAYYAMTKNKP